VQTVTVKDRNGLQAKASCNQRVSQTIPARANTQWMTDSMPSFESITPVKPTNKAYASFVDSVGPPMAALIGNPKVTVPNESVDLDASQSHDFENKPCVEFTFDFGDNSPTVTQKSPFVKHSYKQIGHYPVSVMVTDKNGLTGKAHCNQKVIDTNPAKNNRVDQICPPSAHLIGTPQQSKPHEMVSFDASKSKDMYGKPCASFVWDFGDGTPQQTTQQPTTKHAYKQIGHYPVTVTVKDKNGLTAKASVNQKVSETMPSYQANKKDLNPQMALPNFERMDPVELGDEFRGITSDAISKALMDPNRVNSKKGKQLADVMRQLNPQWPDDELTPDAKNRYKRLQFPMKPTPKKPKMLPKIGIKAGKAEVREVDMSMKVDFGSFEVPDI